MIFNLPREGLIGKAGKKNNAISLSPKTRASLLTLPGEREERGVDSDALTARR
jgi:hypothetical protein